MNKPLLRASMALMILRAAARSVEDGREARFVPVRYRDALVPRIAMPPPVEVDTPGEHWARYVFHSARRHRAAFGFAFALVLGAAIGVALFMPRKFEAHTKLLTHETGVLATPAEGPMTAARERVLARDNLEKIIAETDLIRVWQEGRNPLLRLLDTWADEDPMDQLVEALEKRMTVALGEGTVDIGVTWPEAAMARRIVELAQQSYLETRHVAEVAAVSETIGILEEHVEETQEAIGSALQELQQLRRGLRHDAAPTAPAPELQELRFVLRARQRALSDLEAFRARQLTELRSALERQRTTYSKNHPVILELEQRLAALQKDSPQLARLRHEEADLIKDIEAHGGGKEPAVRKAGRSRSRRQQPAALEASLAQLTFEVERDPNVTVAQDRLRMALARHEELLMRVEAAQLELDTLRAAFKYRFSVVQPAQTPRQPTSPHVALILLGGLLAAVLLALLACTLLDLLRGKACEPWQIEEQLKLPVLLSVRR